LINEPGAQLGYFSDSFEKMFLQLQKLQYLTWQFNATLLYAPNVPR